MNHQYHAINHCIQLLRQSKVPELKKLQMEFQMVQLKRLLMKEDLPTEVISGPCSTGVLETLLADMGKISRGEGRHGAVDDLLTRLNDMRLSVFQTLKEDPKLRID